MRQNPADSGLAPLQAQIAALEQAIGDLRAAGSSEAPDQALREIQTRLAGLEQMATEVTSPMGLRRTMRGSRNSQRRSKRSKNGGAQSSATEESIASLRQEMERLGARLEAAPDEARVAAVEADLNEARRQVGDRRRARSGGRGRCAGGGGGIRPSLQRELDAASRPRRSTRRRSLRLRPYAETGLATLAALRAGFENAIASRSLTAPIPEGTGTHRSAAAKRPRACRGAPRATDRGRRSGGDRNAHPRRAGGRRRRDRALRMADACRTRSRRRRPTGPTRRRRGRRPTISWRGSGPTRSRGSARAG